MDPKKLFKMSNLWQRILNYDSEVEEDLRIDESNRRFRRDQLPEAYNFDHGFVQRVSADVGLLPYEWDNLYTSFGLNSWINTPNQVRQRFFEAPTADSKLWNSHYLLEYMDISIAHAQIIFNKWGEDFGIAAADMDIPWNTYHINRYEKEDFLSNNPNANYNDHIVARMLEGHDQPRVPLPNPTHRWLYPYHYAFEKDN